MLRILFVVIPAVVVGFLGVWFGRRDGAILKEQAAASVRAEESLRATIEFHFNECKLELASAEKRVDFLEDELKRMKNEYRCLELQFTRLENERNELKEELNDRVTLQEFGQEKSNDRKE